MSRNKRLEKRLAQMQRMTSKQTAAAMNAASEALDKLQQENEALRRILTAERAQVIYYTDQYVAAIEHKLLTLAPVGFLDLPEDVQASYVKRAVTELSGDQGTVPHDRSEEPKIILN